MAEKASSPVIFTVGHATRNLEDFVALLRHYGIARLVDVRTVPRSRHNPQFNKETLGAFLAGEGIDYRHLPELGGLRHPRADSPNDGWRNASFRGFADYMQMPAFPAAIDTLLALATERVTAIMCAETVPWRCHRSLIGDALLVRGAAVTDIFSLASNKSHTLTPMAHVIGLEITYPALNEETPSQHPGCLQESGAELPNPGRKEHKWNCKPPMHSAKQ